MTRMMLESVFINIKDKVKDSIPNRVDSLVPVILNEESNCSKALRSIPCDYIDSV